MSNIFLDYQKHLRFKIKLELIHGSGSFLNPTEKVAETYKKVIDDYKEHFCNI